MFGNETDPCNVTKRLSRSPSFIAAMLLKTLVVSCGIVAMCLLIKWQQQRLTVHKSLRILLNNNHVTVILYALGQVVNNGSTTLVLMAGRTGCDMLRDGANCQVIRFFSYTAMMSMDLSLVAICAERLVATIRDHSYEKSGVILGVCLTVVQWLLAAAVTMLFERNTDTSLKLVTCNLYTTKEQNEQEAPIFVGLILLEVVALILLHITYVVNKNRIKNRLATETSLTTKYQVDENVRMATVTLPLMWTHMLCIVPPFTAFAIVFGTRPDAGKFELAQMISFFDWLPFYTLISPIVLYWRNKKMNERIKASIDRGHSYASGANNSDPLNKDYSMAPEQAQHFRQLALSWR